MLLPLPEGESERRSAEDFRTTHWSVVLEAGGGERPEATAAREELCRAYWYPVYAYVRRRGHEVEDAKDLTQEFFMRLLEKNYLAHADRHKGKFRSFLLTALNHFLTNDWRRGQALKRGRGQLLVSLDDDTAESRYALEAASNLTPEKIYERRWALTLLDQALAGLRKESVAADKTRQFEQLKGFLTSAPGQSGYEAVAAELGMTAGAVAAAVHRLRHRYGELVREEIGRTVASPAEVEDEIRWLFSAVG